MRIYSIDDCPVASRPRVHRFFWRLLRHALRVLRLSLPMRRCISTRLDVFYLVHERSARLSATSAEVDVLQILRFIIISSSSRSSSRSSSSSSSSRALCSIVRCKIEIASSASSLDPLTNVDSKLISLLNGCVQLLCRVDTRREKER